jgi:hypothetical protein
MPRTAARRVVPAVLVLVALVRAADSRSAEPGPEVVLRGVVTDEAGAPLGGYPVRLIQTKTILNVLRFTTDSQQLESARTATDEQGRYELRFARDPGYDYYYLRFYDPKTFDPVRFRVPADVDVTRRVKQGTEIEVDGRIPAHPDWPRVRELAAEFGSDSNRGRILLALGLPERREVRTGAEGRESWWYYAKGICYQLQGDDVLKVRRYDPVLPPGGAR